MARRKPKAESTVSFNVTIPRKLARRMDKELAKTRKMLPYACISRSAFYAHALGEWCAILDSPGFELRPLEVRVRTRPKVGRPARTRTQLTPATVRRIRRDLRPSADVARDLGVDRSTVGRVRNGQTWASVT